MNKTDIFAFLKRLIIIAIPIALQQLFLNLASLIDTLMIGQLDDVTISGVYIATQIMFVVNLVIFGATEGGSVFFCQFFGINNVEREKNATWYKIFLSSLMSVIIFIVLTIWGKNIISLFSDNEEVIAIGENYLRIVKYSILPYAISSSLGSSLRECHKTTSSMVITLIGNVVNLILNYIFIFGSFGAPELREVGAAIGTLADRLVEVILFIIIFKKSSLEFTKDFMTGIKFDRNLLFNFTKRSLPLLLNESLWALQQTVLIYFFTQSDAIATTVLPIVSTIFNLLYVVLLGLVNAISILVGNTIGRNENEIAQKQAYISIVFVIISALILGAILALSSNGITSLYNGVSLEARDIASLLIKFQGIYIIITGLNCAIFYLLRAGGRTFIVFLFDSAYGWVVSIPCVIILNKVFNLPFINLYITIYLIDILKNILGLALIFSKKWYKNLTFNNPKEI